MTTEERIVAFEKLGKRLHAIDEVSFEEITQKATNENPWFTAESVRTAFAGIIQLLDPGHLKAWVARYNTGVTTPRTIAVVAAGNIPLVGFHDFLAVLISGHAVQLKPSSKDSELLKFIAAELAAIEPRFATRITFVERLRDFDAVIATGSDNSARYFQYYFGKYPHIIRSNRTSCAILTGKERDEDLTNLGRDIFTYYGLGCRNVSKMYVPAGYDLTRLVPLWTPYATVLNHHKYHNNYDYQKSIRLVNGVPFIDTGFLLIEENDKLVSPISVLYYEQYHDSGDLALKLTQAREKIQCIVGGEHPAEVSFGKAQAPLVWEYADKIDTLAFLESLR